MRIAYLTNQYPHVRHTFIRRRSWRSKDTASTWCASPFAIRVRTRSILPIEPSMAKHERARRRKSGARCSTRGQCLVPTIRFFEPYA